MYLPGCASPRIVFPLPDLTAGPRDDYRGHVGTSSSDSSAAPRNGLLKAAIVCFAVGVVAVLAIFLTPVITDGKPGLVLYLLTLAWPLGFALAIAFALSSGRRARNGDRT
ncbi:Uncharacterised protein [Rhodococcus gordoniae]|uniref:Integral membrane protein n=1 Tax=Rhodococcus gordoniae TaxID=223392 RepID=A0A379M5A0_9NOCA|nr:Uncharacterised protein [Rhodococcus gordoniae]